MMKKYRTINSILSKMIVKSYAKMWPRTVFDLGDGKKDLLPELSELLEGFGVYVLYWDNVPYYIGKTEKQSIYKRLHDHANKSTDEYFPFWTHFSAFIVSRKNYIPDIEGILIASIKGTENKSGTRFEKVHLPKRIANALLRLRRKDIKTL